MNTATAAAARPRPWRTRSSGPRSRCWRCCCGQLVPSTRASSRSTWRDGHLVRPLIDILNRAAPLMTVALGMTLVIATRGIDISVGAVVAIAAAVAATLIGGSWSSDGQQVHVAARPCRWRCWRRWRGAAVRAVERRCWWPAWLGIQPIIATLILMVAGRGIAQLITAGQIVTIYYKPYFFIGAGYWLGLPFALWLVAGRCGGDGVG
jgi:ribose/xylose/arabinose/galactoside ABC-type transport system permease subunit